MQFRPSVTTTVKEMKIVKIEFGPYQTAAAPLGPPPGSIVTATTSAVVPALWDSEKEFRLKELEKRINDIERKLEILIKNAPVA